MFSANDTATVSKGLKDITTYRPPYAHSVDNQQLADDLNLIYCRYNTPHTHSNNLSTHPTISILTALRICEEDVHQGFLKQKSRKAPGSDGVSSLYLRTCTDQLVPVFTQIFNRSLEQYAIPSCFKHYHHSSPKKTTQNHRTK